jgi:PAS domain S-box-containing protein
MVIRVLIVEDDPGDADLAIVRLSEGPSTESEVTHASSLAQAQALLRAQAFGIVVTDLNLPDSRGLNTLRGLRAVNARVPIVVMTGVVDDSLRLEAFDAGAEEVICKDELGSRLFARSVFYVVERNRAAQQREQLEALLECAPSFVLAVDLAGKIQFINRTLPQYSRDEVMAASWEQYIAPDQHAMVKQALADVIATGCQRTFDATVVDPAGSQLFFRSHMGPIRHATEIVGAVIVAQDITNTKRAEIELMAAQRMVAVGTLAAGVAHEINTPIQFVGDSVQFLRDAVNDVFAHLDKVTLIHQSLRDGESLAEAMAACEEAAQAADLDYIRQHVPQALERCIDGLGRVATIVRSLKDFSHPPATEMETADLNRAVQSTLTIATNEYKYWAELETRFDELPLVLCRIDEVNQVVLNLIVNAAHAIRSIVEGTGDRGKIRVETRHEGAAVVITVSDTGPGIPEAIRGRIFDPFFTTKAVGKGTGQGLAIARALVLERHGGDLWFETVVGRGTTFFVRLPIESGRAVTPPTTGAPSFL